MTEPTDDAGNAGALAGIRANYRRVLAFYTLAFAVLAVVWWFL